MNPDAAHSGPEPPPPNTSKLPSVRPLDLISHLPAKDWPHAPVHRLADNAVYFVTAGTLHKKHLFDASEKRDLLERLLLSFAKESGWHSKPGRFSPTTITSSHEAILIRGILASSFTSFTAFPHAK